MAIRTHMSNMTKCNHGNLSVLEQCWDQKRKTKKRRDQIDRAPSFTEIYRNIFEQAIPQSIDGSRCFVAHLLAQAQLEILSALHHK